MQSVCLYCTHQRYYRFSVLFYFCSIQFFLPGLKKEKYFFFLFELRKKKFTEMEMNDIYVRNMRTSKENVSLDWKAGMHLGMFFFSTYKSFTLRSRTRNISLEQKCVNSLQPFISRHGKLCVINFMLKNTSRKWRNFFCVCGSKKESSTTRWWGKKWQVRSELTCFQSFVTQRKFLINCAINE